jgi:ComEC/Rec2-related protein
MALAVWLPFRRSTCVYAAVAFLFATLQVIQTRESSAARLAEKLGAAPQVALIEGIVRTEPTVGTSGKARFVVEATRIEIDGVIIDLRCDILAIVPAVTPTLEDAVRLIGSLRRIAPPRNPGQFDARRVMELRGITCELVATSAKDLEITASARGFSLPGLAVACRKWMEATLREGISDDPLVCNLLAGIVLGVTSDIPDALQDEFRQTGTFHLFSVSGLHVGMIAVILWQVFRVVGVPRGTATCVIIPALFFYALLTGWKPSSIRAATMTAIFLIGMASSRQPVPLNSLCAAAFLILAQSTNELFNPGFQLSVTVVAAILLFSAPIQKLIRATLLPDPFIPTELWTRFQKVRCTLAGITSGLVAVSLAAWIGSLPLTLWYFQLVSISALVANPIIVPLTFVIMSTALLALGCGVFSQFLAAVFNNANLALTHAMLAFIQAVAAMPFSFITLGPPPRAPLEVVVFDLGAGGCAAIRTGGRLCLIDCGNAWDFKTSIQPWMRGIGKLAPDTVVLTHGDAEHIGGAASMATSRPHFVESTLQDRSPIRQKLQAELAARSIPKSIVQSGDVIPISDSATLQILHPPASLMENKADDKAIIARLESRGASILFLSDSGPMAWENLGPTRADIAVIGRHHSGILPEPGFLQNLGIRRVIATAAAFPQNEPIDENWAAALRDRGIELFRMDESGAVEILAGPDRLEIESFLERPQDSPPR